MSSSAAPASPIPLVRDCRPGGLRPLLAPGGRDTYFSADVQRMMFSGDEPLARFLPPAKWTMPDRFERSQDGKNPQVAYTIPDEIIKTARPLATLPRSEIDSFADAVTVFLAKARPDTKGVTPYMRQCRQDFRLPDPDLDAEAYWVYGSEFDRRLLVLWGCEPQPGTSLTLEKLVEKLRAREMSWRDKEELGLKLALRPDEPLSRFLAPRTADGGIQAGGVMVAAKKLKRLRTVTPSLWRAFDEAAKAYYAKAHPDEAGVSPFEKELRREFRLPSFVAAPADFYAVRSRFYIATDAWPRETTLPLTSDEVLKLPEPAGTPAPAAATVSAELKNRLQPAWIPYARIAGGLAALIVVGLVVWLLRPDRTPPAFVDARVVDDHTIVLRFTKDIAKASLLPKAAKTGGRAQDPLSFFDDKMKIASREIGANPHEVIVHTEGHFIDGEKYGIAITQLTDTAGTPNTIAPSNADFSYYDQLAPKLTAISAGGKTKKNLLLVFSKPVAESSLVPSRFAVYEVNGVERGKKLPIVNAVLDPEEPKGTTVELEANDDFVGGKTYSLDINGVTDRAVRPNRAEEKSVTNREFRYVNVLPPRLGDIVASGGKFEVALNFNTPVDPAVARDEADYTLTSPDNKPVPLQKGGIQIDESGAQVSLRLEPQSLSAGNYSLVVDHMADRLGNKTTAPIKRTFSFNDATNRTPLAVVKTEQDGPRVRLIFDRALAPDKPFAVSHYRVLDHDRQPAAGVTVLAAEAVSGEPARVLLRLSHTPGPGQYYIEATGLTDVFGNASDAPVLGGFKIKGIFIAKSSLIDWAQPPLLRGGGQLLVITVNDRITRASAEKLTNYQLEPDTAHVQKLEQFQQGTEDQPQTVIVLRLAAPATPPLTVSADGLILEAHQTFGAQSLRPREAQLSQ